MNHDAIELDRPFGGRIQAAENVHQRGFAAAGGPNDRDEFARFDVEGNIIQRANFLPAQLDKSC